MNTALAPVVLSASANCPDCGMQSLPAGPQAAVLARQAAVTHHTVRGHPVDVLVVTRETIGGDR
jgi:hypothetical protein